MNAIDANRQAALLGLFYYGESRYRPELTPPANLPPELRVVSPDDAIAYLEQDRLAGYALPIRLAIAELVSAPGAFGSDYDDYVRRLADSIHVDGGRVGDIIQMFPGDDQGQRSERFLQGYLLAAGGGCVVRNFRLRAIYQQHISDVTASVEVNRLVDDFADGIDPRNWSVTLPNVWDDSYELLPSPLDTDRRNSPQPATFKLKPPPQLDTQLFEKADWSIGFGQPIAYWRTILHVRLDQLLKAGADSFVRLEYNLFECLENEFFGVRNPGGIDVDSGHGDCRAVVGDPTWSKLEARKAVRFTQPRIEINDLTFVFLIIWFSSLVLIGACA